ncbi:hypothetical protein CYY_001545 [Polysphondylium violaceum]|uniref:non-specific serine/threonine protein kinase n=1 Tax=Polysphondylium violaceum TaxID=133409 RepID=A0A8J4V1J7_9MYCE|nr:hypothetical protein CYY_001545 [Polysphondylium violaceum]
MDKNSTSLLVESSIQPLIFNMEDLNENQPIDKNNVNTNNNNNNNIIDSDSNNQHVDIDNTDDDLIKESLCIMINGEVDNSICNNNNNLNIDNNGGGNNLTTTPTTKITFDESSIQRSQSAHSLIKQQQQQQSKNPTSWIGSLLSKKKKKNKKSTDMILDSAEVVVGENVPSSSERIDSHIYSINNTPTTSPIITAPPMISIHHINSSNSNSSDSTPQPTTPPSNPPSKKKIIYQFLAYFSKHQQEQQTADAINSSNQSRNNIRRNNKLNALRFSLRRRSDMIVHSNSSYSVDEAAHMDEMSPNGGMSNGSDGGLLGSELNSSGLPNSISCDQLNIKYISTKHQRSFLKEITKKKMLKHKDDSNCQNTSTTNTSSNPTPITESRNNSSNELLPIPCIDKNGDQISEHMLFEHNLNNSNNKNPNKTSSPIPIHPFQNNTYLNNTPSTPTVDNIFIQKYPQQISSSLATTTPNKKPIWSPSKGKNHLFPRASAPCPMDPINPVLTPSLSNPSLPPKIGTHHWWGAPSKSVPENLNPKLSISAGACHTRSDSTPDNRTVSTPCVKHYDRGQSDEQIITGRTRSHSNCEGIPIQRAPSVNKWVTAAPSSPPPFMNSNSTEVSPDCLSPVTSMIRIYYVPIEDISDIDIIQYQFPKISADDNLSNSTNATTTTTTTTTTTNNNSISIGKKPSISSTISAKNIPNTQSWAHFWTQVITNTTTVKEMIDIIANKVDKSPDYLKLCCSVNPYDCLDDHVVLNQVRCKKFYMLEVSEEVVIHADVKNPPLFLFPSNANTSMASLGSIGLNYINLNQSSGNLMISSSWSPNNCKFFPGSPPTSPSRFKKVNITSESVSVETDYIGSPNEDFFLESQPMSCSLSINTLNQSGSSSLLSPRSLKSPNTSNDNFEHKISTQLKEKIKILDNYFHHYYRELENYLAQRKKRMDTLHQVLTESGIKENSIAWQRCWREHLQKETGYLRSKRSKIGPSDFQKLTAIGKGGFGKVYLARKKDSTEIVTLKVIRKSSYHRANQMTSVTKEKEVMMIPHSNKDHSQWITRLLYSFHDSQYLYLAMEYHCGGDFRALLNNLETLNDDMAQFYIAEMILAIESLHKLGYIHRDLKPSNFVLDKYGHLKLIDFGLSKEGFISRNSKYHTTWKNLREVDTPQSHNIFAKLKGRNQPIKKNISYSKVGSPEYMAPEMLEGKGYDLTYDFWSLGCVFFEMYVGETPFGGDTPEEVFKNILDWKNILNWNDFSSFLPPLVIDLLKKLLCEPEKRLLIDEIKAHPYFEGLDWENIRSITPPFVPQVQNEIDTSYFEGAENILDEEEESAQNDDIVEAAKEASSGAQNQMDEIDQEDTSFRSMPFGGFNFQRFPSIVEGARAKGLLKSFYVEEKCVSRATSVSSIVYSPPGGSCANSPLIQSSNTTNSSSGTKSVYSPSPSTTPTPTSPNVAGYQHKTTMLRISSKNISTPQTNNIPNPSSPLGNSGNIIQTSKK